MYCLRKLDTTTEATVHAWSFQACAIGTECSYCSAPRKGRLLLLGVQQSKPRATGGMSNTSGENLLRGVSPSAAWTSHITLAAGVYSSITIFKGICNPLFYVSLLSTMGWTCGIKMCLESPVSSTLRCITHLDWNGLIRLNSCNMLL